MSSRDSAVTRAAILDAARKLFEVEGYHGVGLETVAKKAGVSRQAIYLHFASKADLLTELHKRVNEQDVEPAMTKVWRCHDALSGLDTFVTATAVVVPRIIGIFNALEAPARVEPTAEATWQPPQERRYADCLRMAEWLEQEGRLTGGVDARHAADVLFTIVSVRAYESLVTICGWSPRRWKEWTRASLGAALLNET